MRRSSRARGHRVAGRLARPCVFASVAAGLGACLVAIAFAPAVADSTVADGFHVAPLLFEPAVPARCGDLPAAVAEKAASVLSAAQERDYDALLALTAADDFMYSFGDGGGDPTVFWRALDMGGDDVRGAIAAVLQMPCAVADWGGPPSYVWPAAFEVPFDDLSETELAALAALYPGMELDYYFIDDMGTRGYVGWRLVIDEAGNWRYFIAGD